ncbi:DUF4169 family protein [Planktotalea sp.]|uniref:DUF4169 family protein n=1 Tax=Planktotalea sp. TaxID=2029877 RepID=UPI0035C7E875
MGKPVNLNRFKKQKARAEEKARANNNAAVHGLSKAQRELTKAKREQKNRLLDGLKRQGD